jgi:hypothetical protein
MKIRNSSMRKRRKLKISFSSTFCFDFGIVKVSKTNSLICCLKRKVNVSHPSCVAFGEKAIEKQQLEKMRIRLRIHDSFYP